MVKILQVYDFKYIFYKIRHGRAKREQLCQKKAGKVVNRSGACFVKGSDSIESDTFQCYFLRKNKMKKLIAVLVSALFASVAFAKAPAPKADVKADVKAEKVEVKAQKADVKADAAKK